MSDQDIDQPGEFTDQFAERFHRNRREHGGEISAFNLHPHGAAVAVELPLDAPIKKSEGVAGERTYSASV